jgi:zinc D-Ala-D-Ala carboxypeptidase
MATKNFSDDELKCQHCGALNPHGAFKVFMDRIQQLRERYGKPLRVTSGYRCEDHPIEAKKAEAGMHSYAAIDLGVAGKDAYDIVKMAFELGFTGVGVSQRKGIPRFIHLDDREYPAIWSY